MEAMIKVARDLVFQEGPAYDIFYRQFGVKPNVVVYITENWMVQRKIDAPPPSIPPALHPDRLECLLVRLISAETTRYGYCPIGGEERLAVYKPLIDVVTNLELFAGSSGLQPGQLLH